MLQNNKVPINNHVKNSMLRWILICCGWFCIAAGSVGLFLLEVQGAAAPICSPTQQDEIGPFYRPNAPVRSTIGKGYVLWGTVRDATTCRPVAGARIEFWQAGPGGVYSDAFRATVFSDSKGRYRLETSAPPPYARRPPHIHILVDMRGYAGLITQHYPKGDRTLVQMDLVMERE
jgi:protocatechuate 3,4-dioxygenase beta subunit